MHSDFTAGSEYSFPFNSQGPGVPVALAATGAPALRTYRPAAWQKRREASNTPAQRQGVTGLPDWLEGRFPEELSLDAVLEMFGQRSDGEMLPWLEEEHSRTGNAVFVRGHVSVHDVPRKGLYLTITGQGCRELEGDQVVTDWVALAASLWALGFEANRFDFAYDDHAGILPFEEIKKRTEEAAKSQMTEKSFVTRVKRVGGEWSGGIDRPYGYTLGFGVRGSETYVRMYDRAALLRGKGEEVEGECTRVELEWRRERSQSALLAFAGYRMPTVREFMEGVTDAVPLGMSGSCVLAGVLRGHIEFKDNEATHSRLKNMPIAPWWERFLGACEKAKLVVKPILRSVEKSVQWVAKQVAPALGLILKAEGFGLRSVCELAKYGATRFRKSHHEMLETHNSNFARQSPAHGAAYGPDRGQTRRPVPHFGGDGSGDQADVMDPSLIPVPGAAGGPEDREIDPSVRYFSPALNKHFQVGVPTPV